MARLLEPALPPLGAGQYPKGDGKNVVAGDFAADVAATAAVKRVDPGAAGTPGFFLIRGPAGPTWLSNTVANVRDPRFGATGDGASDDQAAIMDAVNSGASTVYFPKPVASYNVSAALTPVANQRWLGDGGLIVAGGGNETKISRATDGPVVSATNIDGVTMTGLLFAGSGSASQGANAGIAFSGGWWTIDYCVFNQFATAAIRWTAGTALKLHHSFTTNCQLSAAPRSTYTAAVELLGDDPHVTFNEFSSVPGGHAYTNGLIGALLAGGTNGFFVGNVGELSEVGIIVTGSWHAFQANRADHNLGHGWVFDAGNDNRVVGNWAHQNSQAANNTYDGFVFTNNANSNVVVANEVTWSGGSNAHRYGFTSDATLAHPSQNTFVANKVSYLAAATADYNTSIYDHVSYAHGTQLVSVGGVGVGNSAAATSLGALSKKMEVFDANGNSLGFVPIYTTIT